MLHYRRARPPIYRLTVAVPVCLPLGRHLFGGRLVGLTRRAQLPKLLPPRSAPPNAPLTAGAQGGFLDEIFASNPLIRQQQSELSSKDFQKDLVYAEVTAVAPAAGGDIDRAPGSQEFKETLKGVIIGLSGASKPSDVIMLKWRSEQRATDGASKATLFSVGFSPVGLHTEFLRRAKIVEATAVGGFRVMESCITVLNAAPEKGFRFFVPLPSGWTDEELLAAMVLQGGLDPDHILEFGADMQKGLKVSAPSGDFFFNYAAGGCFNHGSTDLVPITQPPSRMFVTHPETGIESHIKTRKVGACRDCWLVPGRHPTKCIYSGICKMCLEKLDELPHEGRRHACGQGFMYKAQERRQVFDHGEVPTEAPVPSTLAARIRATQEANIQAAKAKRKRDTAPAQDQAQGPTPSQALAAQDTAANKASRTTGNDSPGGTSPLATNNTATAPGLATTPATVTARAKGSRGKK